MAARRADDDWAGTRPAETADEFFTIGDLARHFGLSLRALRFYEDRGLLSPCRRGTARLYGQRDRRRLELILKGKQLGFTLTEIHEFLAARRDKPDAADLDLDLPPEQIAAQISHLERQRRDIDAAITALRCAPPRLRDIATPGLGS